MKRLPELTGTPWRWLELGTTRRLGVCLISARRYDFATQWRWNWGWWTSTPHKFYPKRNEGRGRDTIYLHREIMNLVDPRPADFRALHHVDHGNGQPLDARDENLRWVTPAENRINRIPWEDVPTIEEIAETLLAEWRAGVERRELEAIPF